MGKHGWLQYLWPLNPLSSVVDRSSKKVCFTSNFNKIPQFRSHWPWLVTLGHVPIHKSITVARGMKHDEQFSLINAIQSTGAGRRGKESVDVVATRRVDRCWASETSR